MPINVLCPTCHKELAAPDELAGQVAECPYCQNRFQVNPPGKSNAQTVRMPVPGQRSTGKESSGAANSGNAASLGVGSKVSMGAPPITASQPSPALESSRASGTQKKSASDEKNSVSMRDVYPPAAPSTGMPPAGMPPAPGMPPTAMPPVSMPSTPMPQPPVAPLLPVGSMSSAGIAPLGPVPPASKITDSQSAPPIVRQGMGSVSMPVPPSIAANSSKPVSTGPLGSATNKPPKAPSTKRRMNRAVFKTADTAKSQVHLGADGRLPELHLEEGLITERPTEEKKQTNPMLLMAVLGFSVGMSVLMLLYEGSSEVTANQSKVQAREIISERYMQGNPLEPYQILLREALQANAQGKYDLERRRYREVLDMLHSEGRSKMEGLTGLAEPAANRPEAKNDSELERQLSILIAD
jgi:hypothetical protein